MNMIFENRFSSINSSNIELRTSRVVKILIPVNSDSKKCQLKEEIINIKIIRNLFERATLISYRSIYLWLIHRYNRQMSAFGAKILLEFK